MTPPKGPAERAAEKYLKQRFGSDADLRSEIRQLTELISAEFASIEQENQRIKEQMVGQRRAIQHEQMRVKAYEQENQKLREVLTEIATADRGDALTQSAFGKWAQLKAQQALATDTKGESKND